MDVQADAAPASFTLHKNPAGFEVEHPQGWTIQGFIERNRRASDWVRSMLSASNWFRNARLVSGGPSRANILGSIAGAAGIMMAMAAPAAVSFTSVPARQSAASTLAFLRYQDPNEMAFSVEAPRGWRTAGGLFRFASVDTRTAVETASPEGIRLLMGDARIPPYTVLDQQLAALGLREGGMYSPGYGVNMQIRRYMPGITFAEWYAANGVGAGAQGLQFVDRKDRPDIAQNIDRFNGLLNGGIVQSRSTAGEVAFWSIQHLYCYLAPAPQVSTAGQVLTRMFDSFRVNPQWIAMQQGINANASRIVAETNAYVSRVHSESFWSIQQAQDRVSRSRSDANLGIVRLEDPGTGQTYTAEAGSNYYGRIAGTDRILGSNTGDFPPRLDVNPLIQLR